MRSLDWLSLMRAGLVELRLRPGDFWSLTPLELLVLLDKFRDHSPTTREVLERLAREFPDERNSR